MPNAVGESGSSVEKIPPACHTDSRSVVEDTEVLFWFVLLKIFNQDQSMTPSHQSTGLMI